MAIYDLGTASLSANGKVTGVGTTWKAPLTLIRVGATIIFKTNPLKIYTISEIISDTQINVYNPNSETVPAGTGYAILAHDGITVQGLAQDVAETLRYYQSKETSIESLLQFIGQDSFDWPRFEKLANQSVTGAAESLASQIAAAESAATAISARDATTAARDATIKAINSAGDAGTLVTLAGYGLATDTTPLISNFDWQEFVFKSGGLYRVNVSSMKNAPNDIISTFGTSIAALCIQVISKSSNTTTHSLRVVGQSSTTNQYSREVYIQFVGAPGSRVFAPGREMVMVEAGKSGGGATASRARNLLDVYSKNETFQKSLNFSDVADKKSARANLGLGSVATENTVPITKGGTAATTAAAARANLGVGDDSNVKHASLRLNGGDSIALNAIESNELTISNTPLGVDNWVGRTMCRWYDDWTRSGLVRDAGAHVSDYRIHVWKSGSSEALFRFTPDQRLISGNTGNPSVNEFQKAPLSDRDLKKEIQYTDGEESYNRVRQWRPAMFKYKDSDVQRHGLIAQDLARIDQEYVHLLPGHAIYEDIKGVDEEGNEVVVDRKEIGYTDDVLSLDSNVLLMDLCAAFVYNLNKVSDLEKEVEELKAIVSELISK